MERDVDNYDEEHSDLFLRAIALITFIWMLGLCVAGAIFLDYLLTRIGV